jgi:putative tryptophan/tyrosine transport system substrate-binding protein
MKRRDFITLLGGAAAWPLAAGAQPLEHKRIAILTGLPKDDPEGEARLGAFFQGLLRLGWSVGHDLEVEHRSAGRDPERYRQYAQELVALRPDLFLAGGSPAVVALQAALQRVARGVVPVVFANATDPAGAAYLARLVRPGRNTAGVMNFEARFAWKWLELLKQVAPQVTRVAILRSETSTGTGQVEAVRSVLPRFGVELTALGDHDLGEVERGLAVFVHGPTDGLIVTAQLAQAEREHIIALAARYRLPVVYPFRRYVSEGGLISYGSDQIEPFRRAAAYVDRILTGERPIARPVQGPAKYETVLNLKTAKAIGLTIPETFLVRADEVIE